MAFSFGFITNVLKDIGKAVKPIEKTALTAAEDVGVAAANAALPGIGGTLAQLAITGITNAVTKHGTAPSSTPAPSDPTITVGQAKKFDVMQFLESNAPAIMNAILAGRGKAVVDTTGFANGTDQIVEGFLAIMKSIGAVPSSTPPTTPVVITPAVIAATVAAPAPPPTAVPQAKLAAIPATASVTVAPFVGTIANLDPTTTADIVDTLAALIKKLQGK